MFPLSEDSSTTASTFPASPNPAQHMRPLSTGELLDRTFAVYRSRFWLFAGISALSGAVQMVATAANLLVHHALVRRMGVRVAALSTSAGSVVSTLLLMLATAVTEAATVWALSEIYLGHPASVVLSLRATAGRWYRYTGIALWQLWSTLWVGLLVAAPALYIIGFELGSLTWLAAVLLSLAVFGGGTWGAIAYLRNSLAVPASVIEQLTLRPSMRRSKVLAAGAKGRIFVVLLIVFSLSLVAGAIETPLLFLIARTPLEEHVAAQMVILVINFISHALISPVALIGLSLVYFDQRVRREALDVLMLLGPDAMHTTVPTGANGVLPEQAVPTPAVAAPAAGYGPGRVKEPDRGGEGRPVQDGGSEDGRTDVVEL